jgi:hypothetical protein
LEKARIVSVPENEADEKALSFTLITSAKKLHFVAESPDDFRSWQASLQTVARNLERKINMQISFTQQI